MRKIMIGMGLAAGILSANAVEWKPVEGKMMTRWAKDVNPAAPHPEHPRPQMVRAAWQNLNGLWQFELTRKDAQQPAEFSDTILVPYPVESALSGLKKRVEPRDRMWYRRTFAVPDAWRSGRVILHFARVDWDTEVLVNGKPAGRHTGGYDPFEFDVTELLKPGADQEIVVSAWDPTNEGGQPIGKQTLHPGGIFYTPSSGIWGTVWAESVPRTYIKRFKIVPDIDAGVLRLTVEADGGAVRAVARDGKALVGEATGAPGAEIAIRIPNAKLWTPDTPFLYDLDVELTDGAAKDAVQGYFGMRKISIGPDENGITRILLNNKFVFQAGPLDQGFWPDGLHTPPTDAALKYDIEMTKAYGFNMSRKHTKVEPDRWYYWCDKLGILVWQDMAGMPGRGEEKSPEQKKQFEVELQRMVETLYNHPSIIMWVVFNEGWGQYDTERLVDAVRSWDSHRLVSNASGWVDHKSGDILDAHTYPVPGGPKPEAKRAAVVGEFGGLGYNMKGRMWVDSGWGYQTFQDEESLNARYEEIIGVLLERSRDPGISAGVYTQVSDIEVENNGLMTYDREVFKVKPEVSARALKGLLPPRKTSIADRFIGTGVIELKGATDKGRIVYTLDGSEPDAHATTYERPVEITKDSIIKARTVWPNGELSRIVSFPMKQTTAQKAVAVAAAGAAPGLQATCFELTENPGKLPDFAKLQPAKTSVAPRVSLAPKTREENYALQFEGFITAPETGVYILRVNSDDGAEVCVGGEAICGKDGIHGMEESAGTVGLEGGAHPIRIRHFQGTGGQGLRLDWITPDGKSHEVPASAFSHVSK
jgi:hypothetical protein